MTNAECWEAIAEGLTNAECWEAGVAESVKRIKSFKNRTVLQMRIKQQLTGEEYEFVCKLVDAQIKLLNMKGGA